MLGLDGDSSSTLSLRSPRKLMPSLELNFGSNPGLSWSQVDLACSNPRMAIPLLILNQDSGVTEMDRQTQFVRPRIL